MDSWTGWQSKEPGVVKQIGTEVRLETRDWDLDVSWQNQWRASEWTFTFFTGVCLFGGVFCCLFCFGCSAFICYTWGGTCLLGLHLPLYTPSSLPVSPCGSNRGNSTLRPEEGTCDLDLSQSTHSIPVATVIGWRMAKQAQWEQSTTLTRGLDRGLWTFLLVSNLTGCRVWGCCHHLTAMQSLKPKPTEQKAAWQSKMGPSDIVWAPNPAKMKLALAPGLFWFHEPINFLFV